MTQTSTLRIALVGSFRGLTVCPAAADATQPGRSPETSDSEQSTLHRGQAQRVGCEPGPGRISRQFRSHGDGNLTGVGADSGSRLAAGALNNPAVYSRLASGVTVSQMLTDFGRTRSLVEAAKLRAQAQDQVTESTRADILLATSRAYFNVLRATAVLQVAQQTVAARQLVSDQVTALEANRLKSLLDVSFANVNLADSKLLLSQAQNDLKSSYAELAAAMGLPSQTAFVLSEEPVPAALPDSIDPLIQDAIQNRPELKDLRLEQDAAERFVKAEHSLFYPTIGALGTAGFVPAGEEAIPGRYGRPA